MTEIVVKNDEPGTPPRRGWLALMLIAVLLALLWIGINTMRIVNEDADDDAPPAHTASHLQAIMNLTPCPLVQGEVARASRTRVRRIQFRSPLRRGAREEVF